MGTEVLTRTRCDRCGTVEDQGGAVYEYPVLWSFMMIDKNTPMGKERDTFTLCRHCTTAVLDLARTAPPEEAR